MSSLSDSLVASANAVARSRRLSLFCLIPVSSLARSSRTALLWPLNVAIDPLRSLTAAARASVSRSTPAMTGTASDVALILTLISLAIVRTPSHFVDHRFHVEHPEQARVLGQQRRRQAPELPAQAQDVQPPRHLGRQAYRPSIV